MQRRFSSGEAVHGISRRTFRRSIPPHFPIQKCTPEVEHLRSSHALDWQFKLAGCGCHASCIKCALPRLRLSAGLINHVSSAYYTDIHVRPQLAEAEGDLVSVEFGSPHVTRDGVNIGPTRVPDLKLNVELSIFFHSVVPDCSCPGCWMS